MHIKKIPVIFSNFNISQVNYYRLFFSQDIIILIIPTFLTWQPEVLCLFFLFICFYFSYIQEELFFHLYFQYGKCKDIRKTPAPAKLCPFLKDYRKIKFLFSFDCCNWEVNSNVKLFVLVLTLSRIRVPPPPFSYLYVNPGESKHLRQISKCLKNTFNPQNNPGNKQSMTQSATGETQKAMPL